MRRIHVAISTSLVVALLLISVAHADEGRPVFIPSQNVFLLVMLATLISFLLGLVSIGIAGLRRSFQEKRRHRYVATLQFYAQQASGFQMEKLRAELDRWRGDYESLDAHRRPERVKQYAEIIEIFQRELTNRSASVQLAA
jgi:hypothetical protein